MRTILFCSVVVCAAVACAGRHAFTTWGYSHWYERSGSGSLGEFEQQQKQCLERIGATADPGSIAPNSPQEDSFLECMNASGWCTETYGCEKPGA